MASNADYMRGLPFEVKANICTQLANVLAEDPRARRHSLSALRRTSRAWSDPPRPLLFRSLRADLWGPRGLQGLVELSRRGGFTQYVRSLTLHVNLYVDTTVRHINLTVPHEGAVNFDLAHEAIIIPRCSQCTSPASILAAVEREAVSILHRHQSPASHSKSNSESGLKELFREIFSELTSLDALSIENAIPLDRSYVQDITDFPNGAAHGMLTWSNVACAVNSALVTGFLDYGNCITKLSISGHHAIFQELTALFSRRDPQPSTLSAATSKVSKLHLHLIDSAHILLPFGFQGTEFIDNILQRLFAPIDDFPQLLDLDIGRSPVSLQPSGYYQPTISSLVRIDFPRLKSLTLRFFYIDAAANLIAFLTQRTPALEHLALDSTTLGHGQCWWATFAAIRGECALKRFRLMGTRLSVEGTGVQWYVSPGPDPRPLRMGDSIELSDLEAWVTGTDIPDPRARFLQPMRRVMVWNAETEDQTE